MKMIAPQVTAKPPLPEQVHGRWNTSRLEGVRVFLGYFRASEGPAT